ncbi:MAG: DUF721 domain-containing protein [Methylococcaceae bacterium]|nr:DUF721 domain-containing protein [Methylococcaceae bacterium]
MSFKSALEFHNRTIDKLVSEIEQQRSLLSVVRSVLPEILAQHTLHCVIHDATLFIYTDASVWSSQLRFYNSTILVAIQKIVAEPIKTIQIRLSRS